MEKKPLANESVPFFARFLEGQELPQVQTDVKAGGKGLKPTQKYPSDIDEAVTLKYPSDGDDDFPAL